MKQLAQPLEIRKPSALERGGLIGYVLGKAFLFNVDVVMHELKVAGDKKSLELWKEKQKTRIRLHNDFKQMFIGVEQHLNNHEVEHLEESIRRMVDALW